MAGLGNTSILKRIRVFSNFSAFIPTWQMQVHFTRVQRVNPVSRRINRLLISRSNLQASELKADVRAFLFFIIHFRILFYYYYFFHPRLFQVRTRYRAYRQLRPCFTESSRLVPCDNFFPNIITTEESFFIRQ